MGFGVFQVFDCVIASGVSTSTHVDFGRAFAKVVIDPTGAAGSVSFQAAPTATSTFKEVSYETTSGVSAPQALTVGSAMSGKLVHVPPLAGHRYVRVVATGTVANGATLKFLCSDY